MRASSAASCGRLLQVPAVQLVEQIELAALLLARHAIVLDVLDQLLDGRVLAVDVGSLVRAGQKGRTPVLGPFDRIAAGAHGDEAGQVLVFGAQAERGPRSQAGTRHPRFAAVHQHQRRFVVRHVGMHRTDHGNVVDVPGCLGKQFADLDAAGTVLLELERRRERRARLALGAQIAAGQFLAGVFLQRRLGIERIDVAWTAVHEQMNDVLGLARKLRGARSHRVLIGGARGGCSRAQLPFAGQ